MIEDVLLTVLLIYLAPTADSSTRPLDVTIAEITKTRTTDIVLEVSMIVNVAQIPRAGSPGSSGLGMQSVRGVVSRSNYPLWSPSTFGGHNKYVPSEAMEQGSLIS